MTMGCSACIGLLLAALLGVTVRVPSCTNTVIPAARR